MAAPPYVTWILESWVGIFLEAWICAKICLLR